MSSQKEIIARIKEALRLVADLPGHGNAVASGEKIAPDQEGKKASARDWLPAVPVDLEGQVEAFACSAIDLKANFFRVDDLAQASLKVNEISQLEGCKLIASHRAPILAEVLSRVRLPVIYTDNGVAASELERADIGITACDALIAQTGSVLLTARSAGGRALSILPPHHLVIAKESQLIADLPAAFELLQSTYGDNFPSMMTLITGPSRTGDIERILVLGAHGPKALTIILVRNV
jgi:L-lactate dehydrogenase complex protein LldG